MKCAVIHRPSEAALSLIARKVRDKALRDIIENGHVESVRGRCLKSLLPVMWQKKLLTFSPAKSMAAVRSI